MTRAKLISDLEESTKKLKKRYGVKRKPITREEVKKAGGSLAEVYKKRADGGGVFAQKVMERILPASVKEPEPAPKLPEEKKTALRRTITLSSGKKVSLPSGVRTPKQIKEFRKLWKITGRNK